jgi:phage/plasmid-like protein (TIGR03299 family)
MSAGLTDSDSMFSVRVTPWHGIGAVLDRPPATVGEAIEASGLGWDVAKEAIAIDRGDMPEADWSIPRCEEIPGYYATVRQDTREVLGIVGERYRIVQNHEAFAFIDQLLGSSINFETAGSLHGGRRVWVLATLPEHVEVGGDPVRPYVLLMNSHDGSTAVIAATTPIRVVCQNTLNWGLAGHSRSSRSATPKQSRSASTRLGGCWTSRSTTTRSSSVSGTSSPPNVAPSASFAPSSMSSTRTGPATR